jgi:hypothetical protein
MEPIQKKNGETGYPRAHMRAHSGTGDLALCKTFDGGFKDTVVFSWPEVDCIRCLTLLVKENERRLKAARTEAVPAPIPYRGPVLDLITAISFQAFIEDEVSLRLSEVFRRAFRCLGIFCAENAPAAVLEHPAVDRLVFENLRFEASLFRELVEPRLRALVAQLAVFPVFPHLRNGTLKHSNFPPQINDPEE